MSPRSIGNHNLNMGMVSCAVQFMTAIDDHDRRGSRYHHHVTDGSYAPVKQPKVCQGCGAADLKDSDCVTGYDHEGETVVITEDERKVIAENSGVDIDIQRFVKEKQIDPLTCTGEKGYYLCPDMDPKRGGKLAAQKYMAIMRVLNEDELVGVVQYTKWGKTRLALLRVVHRKDGDILMIQNLTWPDEVREPDFPALTKAREVEVDPRLLPVARTVIQSMVEDWNGDDYVDTYQEKLTAAITAKAGGKPIELTTIEAAPKIDDMDALLAQLTASVKTPVKAPVKKAPAKKAAPRKVVA